MASSTRKSKRKAYATAYFTGKAHYRDFSDSNKLAVRGSAKRGYRRGLRDAHFEYKQRQRMNDGD